jgi:hypothetical protein
MRAVRRSEKRFFQKYSGGLTDALKPPLYFVCRRYSLAIGKNIYINRLSAKGTDEVMKRRGAIA